MGQKLKLHDEWNSGLVSLWSVNDMAKRMYVPEGTYATVLGRSMNGYLLVQVNGDIWEVWHENSNQTLN